MRGAWTLVVFCGLLQPGLCLECLECHGLPYNCTETVRECYAHQPTCISTAYSYEDSSGTKELLVKGCSQGLSCNESAYVNMGTRAVYISNTCCSRNQCNSGTYYAKATVSQADCAVCSGDSASCSSPALRVMHCTGVQDLCMSITTLTIFRGAARETVVKGCGTGPLCGRTLEYNTGNTTLYNKVECCHPRNCKPQVPTVSVNNTLNGLQCFACNETGKNECNATRITTVNCTGQMNRCLDIVDFGQGKTLMRGCCSEDVCRGLPASLSVPSYQSLYCCQGNLCNNGNIASYFSGGRSLQVSGASLAGILLLGTAWWWAL
ncbi:urokinase plasminogen activator surface receptor-like isoform X1 [Pleurodeles waltl]|uniref:urokinase plasminogen activator surface receptor-like isoform X1 n=1 Tax=Pleurodeles waltl TaxID=8319 RepID=UPI0037096EDE